MAADEPRTHSGRPHIWMPPPLLFAAGLMAAWWLETQWSIPIVPGSVTRAASIVGWLLAAAGTALSVWAMMTFARHDTPVLPVMPARTVVQTGPYRFTRNPIYLGLAGIYAGLTLVLNTLWALLALPVVLLVLYYLVIRIEEAHMRERFGETYEAYLRRVRRWF